MVEPLYRILSTESTGDRVRTGLGEAFDYTPTTVNIIAEFRPRYQGMWFRSGAQSMDRKHFLIPLPWHIIQCHYSTYFYPPTSRNRGEKQNSVTSSSISGVFSSKGPVNANNTTDLYLLPLPNTARNGYVSGYCQGGVPTQKGLESPDDILQECVLPYWDTDFHYLYGIFPEIENLFRLAGAPRPIAAKMSYAPYEYWANMRLNEACELPWSSKPIAAFDRSKNTLVRPRLREE